MIELGGKDSRKGQNESGRDRKEPEGFFNRSIQTGRWMDGSMNQLQLAGTKRMPLHRLKDSKSLSETITSVDSDSSGRRMTEHETSPSSGVQSPEVLVLPEDLSSVL